MNDSTNYPSYNYYPKQQPIQLSPQGICLASTDVGYPQSKNCYGQSLCNNDRQDLLSYYYNDNKINNSPLNTITPSIISNGNNNISSNMKTMIYSPIQNNPNPNHNYLVLSNNTTNQISKEQNNEQFPNVKYCPQESLLSYSVNNNTQFHENIEHVIYHEQKGSTVNNQMIYYSPSNTSNYNITSNNKELPNLNNISNVVPIPGGMAYSHPLITVIPSAKGNTKKQLTFLFEDEYMKNDNQNKFLNDEKIQRQIKIISAASSLWTSEEDKLLRKLKEVKKLGWRDISMYFPSRTIYACQFRWRRLVDKEKKKFRRGLVKLDKIKSNFPEEIQKFSS